MLISYFVFASSPWSLPLLGLLLHFVSFWFCTLFDVMIDGKVAHIDPIGNVTSIHLQNKMNNKIDINSCVKFSWETVKLNNMKRVRISYQRYIQMTKCCAVFSFCSLHCLHWYANDMILFWEKWTFITCVTLCDVKTAYASLISLKGYANGLEMFISTWLMATHLLCVRLIRIVIIRKHWPVGILVKWSKHFYFP